jgi:D-serine deaminase-like pyridoxal phosphate-dependent protein
MDVMPTIPTLGAGLMSGGWQQLLLPLGVVLVMLSIFTSMRKRRKRQATQIDPREQLERVRQRDAVRDDLRTLMVEVEQLAKRMGAQLDAKAVRLERLIDEADRKLAELEMAGGEPVTGGNEQRASAVSPSPRDPVTEPHAGRDRAASDPAGSRSAAAATTEREPADPLAASVHRLADTGLDAMQIARKLGEHVGKVELILALRKV